MSVYLEYKEIATLTIYVVVINFVLFLGGKVVPQRSSDCS